MRCLIWADDVCALILLHAHALKLVQPGVKWHKLDAYLTTQELRKRHWLLAYEAEKKGWLKPSSGSAIAGDPVFDFIHKQGVEFYDVAAIPAPPKPIIKKVEVTPPEEGYEEEPDVEFEEDAEDSDY